jgi:formylglycine-generating enzyme required for sulfatase activity
MGSERGDDNEKPVHPVYLPEYRIGKYPVVNAEYKRFLDETGYPAPPDWNEGNYPSGKANHPVVTVTWRDAVAYCRWLSQKTGKTYRLPTEAEWEKAARGTDGREYPWGNSFDPARCNSFDESGIGTTTPVGIYPDGASPCGAMDMAGNVWEWCQSLYQPYPYRMDDGREDLESEGLRVLRGGSFGLVARGVRGAFRYRIVPGFWLASGGFRCVLWL